MDHSSESYRKTCRLHAKRRALERYGVSLSRRDLNQLADMVRKGDPTVTRHVERQTTTRSLWHVYYKDRWLAVVYHKRSKEIVTVLPYKEGWRPSA